MNLLIWTELLNHCVFPPLIFDNKIIHIFWIHLYICSYSDWYQIII
ncbi:hypothetical protein ACJIZ3_006479 [Penstemon smallii]|uniref:Uncharacterized protein n=1 Tax=Penstemon smallii TaxID=265156 RepID=A0ABD3S7Y3_9LAMI